MLLRKEVTHATDVELLTVILGNRKTATKLLAKAHFSLFALLHSIPRRTSLRSHAELNAARRKVRSAPLRAVL